MRVSIIASDPGFHAPYSTEIYCDGERVENVVTADEEEGFVLHLRCDEQGEFILAYNLEMAVFRKEGKVTILFPRGFGGT